MRIILTSLYGQFPILVDAAGLNFLWDNKFTLYWNAVDWMMHLFTQYEFTPGIRESLLTS